ncbi:Solute carrier family 35 member C2 (Ovarian cancer-overexpressed gene 1 protein), partial [Durusdinium trenchii]
MSHNVTSPQSPEQDVKGDAEEQFFFMLADGSVLFALSFGLLCCARLVKQNMMEGSRKVWVIDALEVGFWSALWFAFSVSLVVYNKWLLHSWQGGFDFPLIISMAHMFLKYLLSWLVVRCSTKMTDAIPTIPRRVWWLSAVPVGTATALDVAASNASYLYITVTFYTVVKSSSLIFVLFFSILYKLQPCSLSLTLSVFVIGAGVFMASFGDTEFSAIGFGLVLGASAVGGFRWALTQVLMKQIRCSLDAILTIYLISPASALTLVPMALWLEGARFFSSKFLKADLVVLSMLNIFGSGLFAFAMILVELELLRKTSSMTLGVISYVKQILQIGLSVLIFHDKLTALNVIGFLLTLLGMSFYSYIKNRPSETHRTYTVERGNDGLFVFDEQGNDLYSAGRTSQPNAYFSDYGREDESVADELSARVRPLRSHSSSSSGPDPHGPAVTVRKQG